MRFSARRKVRGVVQIVSSRSRPRVSRRSPSNKARTGMDIVSVMVAWCSYGRGRTNAGSRHGAFEEADMLEIGWFELRIMTRAPPHRPLCRRLDDRTPSPRKGVWRNETRRRKHERREIEALWLGPRR